MVINVQDASVEKIHKILKNFSETDVEIIEDIRIEKSKNDFIYRMANKPMHLNEYIAFLNRDEANER